MNNEEMMMTVASNNNASNNNSNKESEKKMMNKIFSKKIAKLIPLTNNVKSDIQFAFNYLFDDDEVFYTTFFNNHLWVSRATQRYDKYELLVVEDGKISPCLFTIKTLKSMVKVNTPVSYNMNVKNHHIKFYENRFMIVHHMIDDFFEICDATLFKNIWRIFFKNDTEFGRSFSYKTLKKTLEKMGYEFAYSLNTFTHRKNLIVAETKKSMVA